MSVFVGRRRILLSHSITMQSTHSTVAGCQKRHVHHAGHLNKKKQEIAYASTPQEAVPQRCKILGTSYVREHCIRNKNQIWHGDQTRCWKFLYGRPRMLARDRFAVDDLPCWNWNHFRMPDTQFEHTECWKLCLHSVDQRSVFAEKTTKNVNRGAICRMRLKRVAFHCIGRRLHCNYRCSLTVVTYSSSVRYIKWYQTQL